MYTRFNANCTTNIKQGDEVGLPIKQLSIIVQISGYKPLFGLKDFRNV